MSSFPQFFTAYLILGMTLTESVLLYTTVNCSILISVIISDEGTTILFVEINKGKHYMTVRLNLKTAEATFDSTNKKQYFPKLPDSAKIWK